MKKFRKLGSVLIISSLVLGASVAFSEPGSSKDPLISKSYVDKQIEEVRSYIDKKLDRQPAPSSPSSGGDLVVVELGAGQSLVGEAGTEIILRSGSAVAIGSDQGGLSDITKGKDIETNGKIEKNHLLIVPRTDGRGIYGLANSYVMVRGSFSIY